MGHILNKSTEGLSERTRMRSLRLLKQATTEIFQSLHVNYKTLTNDTVAIDQWRKGNPYVFPYLNATIAVGEWQDDVKSPLSFKAPELGVLRK